MQNHTKLTHSMAALLCMSLVLLDARGGESAVQADKARTAFDGLKSLQGRWAGEEQTPDGQTRRVEYIYQVRSNGTAVVETAMAGAPEEMITVFYMAGDQLQASHYCAIGNQPAFRYSPGNDDRITMAFAGGTGFDPAIDGHVHEGWIRLVDRDRMEQSWVFYDKGVAAGTALTALTRQPD